MPMFAFSISLLAVALDDETKGDHNDDLDEDACSEGSQDVGSRRTILRRRN